MDNYVKLSLETHLFFSRIMKEHSLFLEAGFPCKNKEFIEKADWFRQQFECLLLDTIELSDGRVGPCIVNSCELVTEFTIAAEERTSMLSGIPIDSEISRAEKKLCSGQNNVFNRNLYQRVHQINLRAIRLLNGLIEFKEKILEKVECGGLFTTNYPLLIQHILREAKLYRTTVENLIRHNGLSHKHLREMEEFWNQIMMEHALFIRGLLDPSEAQLIETADQFAQDYHQLLETARARDSQAANGLTQMSLTETLKYRDFKAAGTKGILECKIASIILPLLADHVLREANHFIRILECDCID